MKLSTLSGTAKRTTSKMSSSDHENRALQRSLDEKYDSDLKDNNKQAKRAGQLGTDSRRNADGLVIDMHASGLKGKEKTDQATRSLKMQTSEDDEVANFKTLRRQASEDKEKEERRANRKAGNKTIANPLSENDEDEGVGGGGCCGGKDKKKKKKKSQPTKLGDAQRKDSDMMASADAKSIRSANKLTHHQKHKDIDLE